MKQIKTDVQMSFRVQVILVELNVNIKGERLAVTVSNNENTCIYYFHRKKQGHIMDS